MFIAYCSPANTAFVDSLLLAKPTAHDASLLSIILSEKVYNVRGSVMLEKR